MGIGGIALDTVRKKVVKKVFKKPSTPSAPPAETQPSAPSTDIQPQEEEELGDDLLSLIEQDLNLTPQTDCVIESAAPEPKKEETEYIPNDLVAQPTENGLGQIIDVIIDGYTPEAIRGIGAFFRDGEIAPEDEEIVIYDDLTRDIYEYHINSPKKLKDAISEKNEKANHLNDILVMYTLADKYTQNKPNKKVILDLIDNLNEKFNDERGYNLGLKLTTLLIDKYAGNEHLRLDRSIYYNGLGLFDDAISDMERYVKNEDLNSDEIAKGFAFLGIFKYNAFVSQNKLYLESAIEDFNKYIEIHKNAAIYKYRGFCKQKLNDLNGALEDYNSSLELDPDQFQCLEWRLLVRGGLEEWRGASEDYVKMLELVAADKSNTDYSGRDFWSTGELAVFKFIEQVYDKHSNDHICPGCGSIVDPGERCFECGGKNDAGRIIELYDKFVRLWENCDTIKSSSSPSSNWVCPMSILGLNSVARINERVNDVDRALNYYKKSLTCEPLSDIETEEYERRYAKNKIRTLSCKMMLDHLEGS